MTLSKALAKHYAITALVPRLPEAPAFEKLDGLEVHRFRYFPRRWEGLAHGGILPILRKDPWRVIEIPSFILAFLISALRLAKTQRVEVIHAHWILPAGLIAMVIKKIANIPYVVTAHGADAHALQKWPFSALKRSVMRNACVVSPASLHVAHSLGFDAQTARGLVVPMGVDAGTIRSEVGARDPKKGRFLFVGRLEAKKGVDVLIRAAAQVASIEVVIVGDGTQMQSLQSLTRTLGVSDRVSFLGKQPRSEVIDQLKVCHAIVIPSIVAPGGDTDGTPLVMSEAMAAGVPVIASNLGGLREQITTGENGLLFEPESDRDLARAMSYVLTAEDEALLDLTEEAQRRMRSALDIGVTSSRYKGFFEQCIGKDDA